MDMHLFAAIIVIVAGALLQITYSQLHPRRTPK